jgi:UDP-2,3-diacylglucosamine pyrophosphatase LpxH
MKRVNDAFVERWNVNAGFEKKILLMSDVHFDSPHCNRKMLKRHLDEALDLSADIWVFGDLFDVMGGKNDPRSTKGVIRAYHSKDDYLNQVVEEAAEFLMPYKENIKFMSLGNHEESILKHNEVSLLSVLNYLLGGHIVIGGYYGWIRVMYSKGTRTDGKMDGSYIIYYNHGVGGDNMVTKGTSRSSRRDQTIDADIYISGHTHQGLLMPTGKRRLNMQNNEVVDWRQHIVLKTYEDDSSWMKRNELQPHLLGGVWLEFSKNQDGLVYTVRDAK